MCISKRCNEKLSMKLTQDSGKLKNFHSFLKKQLSKYKMEWNNSIMVGGYKNLHESKETGNDIIHS